MNIDITDKIFTVRGMQVMTDSDLAELYGVETKALNQAVKRNIKRFPERFMFRLTAEEYEGLKLQDIAKSNNNLKLQSSNPDNISLRSQNVTLNKGRGKHKKYFPYAFTEQGVSMLAAVLRSETAINTSIRIMDAFVEMRKYLLANAGLLQRIETVEIRQAETDRKVEAVLNTIGSRSLEQKTGDIFLKGKYTMLIAL